MESISGYARILARMRVEELVTRPFLRKAYVKYGQCLVLWGYFFQVGGILSSKHSANLDAFGHAFLGAQGPPGAILTFFTDVAKPLVTDSAIDSMSFWDFISAEFIERVGYAGEANEFFSTYGMKKMRPDTAKEFAWQCSEQGAALGAVYPQIFWKMFERTHTKVSKETWAQAHAAGLDIPSEQDNVSYENTEEGEDGLFMAYCSECCPDLYSILSM